MPYYCFHDVDIAPEGNSVREYVQNFHHIVDILERKQVETGVKLLWGTANCFTNPRYMSVQQLILILRFLLGLQHKCLMR